MTVESAIFDALSPLVSGRVFPDFAPTGTATPYIAFQQVGGRAPGFLENAVPSKKNARFQVSAWGPQRAAIAELALQIEAAMVAMTAAQARPLSAALAAFDDDTQLRGSQQDFEVWSDR